MASSQFGTRASLSAPLSVATAVKVLLELPSLPSTRPRLRRREPTRGATFGLRASTPTMAFRRSDHPGPEVLQLRKKQQQQREGPFSLINRRLVEQTRDARISKKIEASKDGTEYCLSGGPSPLNCLFTVALHRLPQPELRVRRLFPPAAFSVDEVVLSVPSDGDFTRLNWRARESPEGTDGTTSVASFTCLASPAQQQEDQHGMLYQPMPYRLPTRNLKPKAIKRMAAPHEIRMLMDKEGNDGKAKAKCACQQKVYQHHLDMEIIEAEFQWDWQKLIFYYYADHYVSFKDLVNDLYKVCLWMSAVNPASFSASAISHWWLSDLAPSSHAPCLV